MATISILRAAGLTDAQILKVLELEQTEKMAARREQNRINKQNQRARQHVTADRADHADTMHALPSKKEEVLKEESKKETKKRSVGFVCPSDFKPDDGDYKVGSDYGLSRSDTDSKCATMIDWSQANRNRAIARKSDWHLTLRGFLRRDGKPRQPGEALPGDTVEERIAEYHRRYSGGDNGKEKTAKPTSDGSRDEGPDNEQELFPTR